MPGCGVRLVLGLPEAPRPSSDLILCWGQRGAQAGQGDRKPHGNLQKSGWTVAVAMAGEGRPGVNPKARRPGTEGHWA